MPDIKNNLGQQNWLKIITGTQSYKVRPRKHKVSQQDTLSHSVFFHFLYKLEDLKK